MTIKKQTYMVAEKEKNPSSCSYSHWWTATQAFPTCARARSYIYIYSSVQAKKKTNEPDMPPSLAHHQKYAAWRSNRFLPHINIMRD
jgi:hypothetical protein